MSSNNTDDQGIELFDQLAGCGLIPLANTFQAGLEVEFGRRIRHEVMLEAPYTEIKTPANDPGLRPYLGQKLQPFFFLAGGK